MSENPYKHYLTTQDHLVTGEEFTLVYDEEFDMLRTQPQPKNLAQYYQSEDYISHTDSNKGLVAKIYQWVKSYSLKKKVKLIKRMNKGVGSVLDVGAGTGDFLVSAQTNGWDVHGVEINLDARQRASKKGVELVASLEAFEGKMFDVITLWHVLEHLPDLEKITSQLTALLKEGGTLIIAVPNFRSADAGWYKEHWAAYDTPRHLWHFTRKSLKKLFPDFSLITEKPMLFDSYYVIILSEKYKLKNRFPIFWYIAALIGGTVSNLYGYDTGEYSSLIYVLKKHK